MLFRGPTSGFQGFGGLVVHPPNVLHVWVWFGFVSSETTKNIFRFRQDSEAFLGNFSTITDCIFPVVYTTQKHYYELLGRRKPSAPETKVIPEKIKYIVVSIFFSIIPI